MAIDNMKDHYTVDLIITHNLIVIQNLEDQCIITGFADFYFRVNLKKFILSINIKVPNRHSCNFDSFYIIQYSFVCFKQVTHSLH